MKRVVIIVIAIAAVVGLGLAAWITSGSFEQQIPNRSATNTAKSISKSFLMGMLVVPDVGLVPLGGLANFTLSLYNAGDITGNYSLSAMAPSGLSFEFSPNPVSMSGCERCGAILLVNSSASMEAGTYQVTIEATGSRGLANQTFDFHVQRNLVILSAEDSHAFTNLTMKAGDAITWVAWDPALSDTPGRGWHQVIFPNSTVTSGPIRQYQTWSYTFNQRGIYRWYDIAMESITGEVIVTP